MSGITSAEYDRIIGMIRQHVATDIIARETGRAAGTINRMRQAMKHEVSFPPRVVNASARPVHGQSSSLVASQFVPPIKEIQLKTGDLA